MLNQQSEQKFFESMDAAEASAARAFIGEDAWDGEPDPDGLDAQGQAAWNELQRPEAIEPLCEGCHRKEEMCICGGVPDETTGWPPSAQETVYYQQIMAKPDEF